MARPIANPITYGTLSGNVPMSDLDTSFNALFTTGFNDSSLGWINYAADTGVANAYAVTLSVTPSSYTSGMCVTFTPQNTNTAASTINVNALGAKSIVNKANLALSGGEIIINKTLVLVYDGTSFRIVSENKLTQILTNPGTLTVDCAGYDSVNIRVKITAANTPAITLNHLAAGVTVSFTVGNQAGSTQAYALAANDPSGTAFATVAAVISASTSGTTSVSLPPSVSILNNNIVTLVGLSTTNELLLAG